MNTSLHTRPDGQTVVPIADRLIAEYHGVLAPSAVLRCVARCRHQLRHAGVRAGLDDALEAMARHRLRQLHALQTG